ncbi:MAG: FAD binding domain-containing protein, partial [Pseudomonadota bacterium]
ECSASCQSDGAAMLSALSVQVVLKSAQGERLLPLAELFSGKGEAPFTLRPEELLTQVRIFLPPPGTGTSYHKLRWRSAIDFPLVSAGASVTLSRGRVDRARLALGGVGAAPVVVEDADHILRGREPSTDRIDQAAAAAQKKAEGLIVDNTMAPAEYRRKMIRVMARRALSEAVERGGAG